MSRDHPWIKFYPQDWRTEPGLLASSLEARAVWLEMICLMHEAEPYGHMLIGSVAPSAEKLARMLNCNQRVLKRCLNELETHGVFSRNSDGVIYSRRMVRDREKALEDKANGHRGGNPNLAKNRREGVNPPDKAQSQKLDVRENGGGDARARDPASLVIEAVNHPMLDPSRSQGLVLSGGEVVRWIREGATLEDITLVVSSICAQRKPSAGPVQSWAYFAPAVRRHVAERLAPDQPIQPAIRTEAPTHEVHFGDSQRRAGKAHAADVYGILAERARRVVAP